MSISLMKSFVLLHRSNRERAHENTRLLIVRGRLVPYWFVGLLFYSLMKVVEMVEMVEMVKMFKIVKMNDGCWIKHDSPSDSHAAFMI